MLSPLSSEQKKWVEQTLSSLSMEEMAGQLFAPDYEAKSSKEWLALNKNIAAGALFLSRQRESHKMLEELRRLQDNAKVPILIVGDMENGVSFNDEYPEFSSNMGCRAADSLELVRKMGAARGREARSLGVHWTFSPVADLCLNFRNSIVNIRSAGDRPENIIPYLSELIEGIQANNLCAATAKHFPGDGVDDRDQHLCTSVNSLPVEQWFELYGKVWQAVIDAGVMSMMVGHIAFPDWQGNSADPSAALPATLCPRIHELLRKKLGFKGLIISDAMAMTGVASRVPKNDIVWRNIAAGSDMALISPYPADRENLMNALKNKQLSEERLVDAARHVLEMKARLNIHKDPFGELIAAKDLENDIKLAGNIADRSITAVRRKKGLLPLNLKKGDRVFTFTITVQEEGKTRELSFVDEELKKRGLIVEHSSNPDRRSLIKALEDPEVKMVFVNFFVASHMEMGRIMMCGNEMFTIFWDPFYMRFPDKTVFTSFANPFVLYEQPHINNLLLTYSGSPLSQKAAVKAWLGEIKPKGQFPFSQNYLKVRPFEYL